MYIPRQDTKLEVNGFLPAQLHAKQRCVGFCWPRDRSTSADECFLQASKYTNPESSQIFDDNH